MEFRSSKPSDPKSDGNLTLSGSKSDSFVDIIDRALEKEVNENPRILAASITVLLDNIFVPTAKMQGLELSRVLGKLGR